MVTNAIASGLAKEAGGSTVDVSKTYINKGSKEDEFSCYKPKLMGRVHVKTQSIYDRGGLWKKLL